MDIFFYLLERREYSNCKFWAAKSCDGIKELSLHSQKSFVRTNCNWECNQTPFFHYLQVRGCVSVKWIFWMQGLMEQAKKRRWFKNSKKDARFALCKRTQLGIVPSRQAFQLKYVRVSILEQKIFWGVL